MQDRHRNSAANGGQLPGATGERTPAGLAITIAVVMALAVPRIRLRLPVPVASRRARSLAWGCGRGSGDMMNVFTASGPEAADALAVALARHDGDGAPPAVTPLPASDGQGSHAMRLAGTGQVTASRAGMIAAAPGRARQQLTPALMGVG